MHNEKIHKRGRYSAEFKEKVALEALTGAKMHAQIASEYGISPDLVKDWEKQAKEMLGECFRRAAQAFFCKIPVIGAKFVCGLG